MFVFHSSEINTKLFFNFRLDLLEPEWRGTEVRDPTANSGWVSVSCPHSDEVELNDADKTVWDRVKEGDVSGLRTEIGNGVSMKDEAGLTLLHWAADRGHCEVAKLLLDAEPSILNVQVHVILLVWCLIHFSPPSFVPGLLLRFVSSENLP